MAQDVTIERLKALLRQCPRHIRGNIGAWEMGKPQYSSHGVAVADKRIEEGHHLLAEIREVLGDDND